MSEEELATGGYVIAGKSYILGEEPDYWAGPLPKGLIEIKVPDNISEEEISVRIRESIRELLRMQERDHG